MSRTYKFRAWDRELKIMLTGHNQYGQDEPGINSVKSSTGAFTRLWEALARFKEDDRFILMQFTGLFDKHGKEIWEGDIVRSTSRMMKLMSNKPTGKMSIVDYHIIYVEEQARFATKNPKRDTHEPFALTQSSMTEFYEIIGSIHQSPELKRGG